MLELLGLRKAGADAPHRARIENLQQWQSLAVRHGYQTAARTETVKFACDQHDRSRLYFFDSKRWETHFGFVQRFIDPRADYERFLSREYLHPQRRFLLGSVMHYLDGEHWTLELSSGDTMEAQRIVELFRIVRAALPFAPQVSFRPVSPAQIEIAQRIASHLPVLSRDAINASVVYQPVVLGTALGQLRLLRGKLDVSAVRPYDIVVTDEVPDEMPPVAALVTSQLQAPLAHVAVLSRNRNTPDMACRGAIDLPVFRALEGQLVKLTVGGQDYTLERADPAQAELAWQAMRPAAVEQPAFDATHARLTDVAELGSDSARFAGAKAAQLGMLRAVDGIEVPDGFVVPFAAYLDHLRNAGVRALIDALLSDPLLTRDAVARAQALASVREAICAHPVDPDLLDSIQARLRALGARQRFILRSSTNAEDLPGFNGAGLYESLPMPAGATPEDVATTLRAVWASVWLQRAYEERDWYRIDHRQVAMAVLVQPYLHEMLASGVAITGNPFKPDLAAVFINVQTQGASVTGALGNEIPEQYLVATWSGVHEYELISHSSLTDGRPILQADDLQLLTDRLLRIHNALVPAHGARANAMDVEFVQLRDRRFVFVQARPYQIVHDADRMASVTPERRMNRLMRIARRIAYRFIPNRLAYTR